ncbi:helix-turn-helix transcriptional regulator [Calothrix sp. NIES-2100]
MWYLRQTNYSYKQIASKLYMSVNTVKQHMKNIYFKRQLFLESAE